MKKGIIVLASAIGIAVASSAVLAGEVAATADLLYAVVNDKPITQKDFQAAYGNYVRQKYYHGQVSDEQLAAAKQEVGDRLVERILLLDEAARRGLTIDEQGIAATIAEYEARYATSPMWQKNREELLPGLKQQLGEQDLLRQIEAIGHATDEPTDAAVRDFHQARIDLFTEPEKMRLHTILLKVDPSAPASQWDAAREEARRLVARLRAGEADFAELAGLHSQDRSADQGGDMGYLHRGMIPEQVQTQIDAQPLGTVCDPIDVLEGVAVFRLDERVPAKVMAYEDVAARARDLLKREQTNRAWEAFIAGLRKTAVIKLVEPAPPATQN